MAATTLRERALKAIGETRWVPPQGENRIRGMVETRPDWVVSRQRAWGVPITVFRHKETGRVIPGRDFNASGELIDRITEAFRKEGADAWFEEGAKERFLQGLVDDPAEMGEGRRTFSMSGSIQARPTPSCWRRAPISPGLPRSISKAPTSIAAGSNPRCSKLAARAAARPSRPCSPTASSSTRTGAKCRSRMGNVVAPQDVIRQSGAEILRLWAMSSDYAEDLRIGQDIIKANVESYRKLRNTLRFMLGNLAHYQPSLAVGYSRDAGARALHAARGLPSSMSIVTAGYNAFDFKRVFHALFNFCVNDLSAFYFDIRKDALYCDPYDSLTRRAALTVLDHRVRRADRLACAHARLHHGGGAGSNRFPGETDSVHLRQFPAIPCNWRDEALAEKWRKVRAVRRVVTGALEIERKFGRIGSSLEAAPRVYIADRDLRDALAGVDLAEVAITSGIEVIAGDGPEGAFRLDEVPGIAVVFVRAQGTKCARSWKILEDVGADPEFPELSPRDAEAVRQFDARQTLAAAE